MQRVAVGVGEAMADASEFHAAAHRLGSVRVPWSISGFWSISVNTLSADTSIFCMRAATLVRRLMGSKICARAAMNEAKLPTVRSRYWPG